MSEVKRTRIQVIDFNRNTPVPPRLSDESVKEVAQYLAFWDHFARHGESVSFEWQSLSEDERQVYESCGRDVVFSVELAKAGADLSWFTNVMPLRDRDGRVTWDAEKAAPEA